jgi:DMSO/TMAO reductase YedYZ molybdopterin-dependent catalytic subunit
MAEMVEITSPDTLRENRVPPGQKLTKNWPVLHYGNTPTIDTSKWTFKISGRVRKEITFSYDEFIALPRVRVFSDIHCVTTWSKLDNTWEGPSSESIFKIADTLDNAHFVIVHGYGGFTTNLSLPDFLENDVLFTLTHEGEPLSPGHGFPVRLIVPRLYFWKSAKWVTGIQFVEKDVPGFWESNGYHNHGDPWKEERYS